MVALKLESASESSQVCHSQVLTKWTANRFLAYVQQEDLFYAELTVREHLTYLVRTCSIGSVLCGTNMRRRAGCDCRT